MKTTQEPAKGKAAEQQDGSLVLRHVGPATKMRAPGAGVHFTPVAIDYELEDKEEGSVTPGCLILLPPNGKRGRGRPKKLAIYCTRAKAAKYLRIWKAYSSRVSNRKGRFPLVPMIVAGVIWEALELAKANKGGTEQ